MPITAAKRPDGTATANASVMPVHRTSSGEIESDALRPDVLSNWAPSNNEGREASITGNVTRDLTSASSGVWQ